MRCPRCHDEYHDDVATCVDCGVALVSDDTPLAPRADAHLGRFHPIVAGRIVPVLQQRKIAYETDPADVTLPGPPAPSMTTTADPVDPAAPRDRSGAGARLSSPVDDRPDEAASDATAPDPDLTEVTIRVQPEYRDDLRSELAVNWSDIIGRLPADEMYAVLAAGGTQAGWFDGPTGAWVDRQGRIQVEAAEDELASDADRMLGPSLAVIGAILVIFGLWAGGSSKELIVIVGAGLLATGLFLPR